jgi:hypothetical protein
MKQNTLLTANTILSSEDFKRNIKYLPISYSKESSLDHVKMDDDEIIRIVLREKIGIRLRMQEGILIINPLENGEVYLEYTHDELLKSTKGGHHGIK